MQISHTAPPPPPLLTGEITVHRLHNLDYAARIAYKQQMTIGEWLKLVHKSTDAFGARVGVSGATVRRWRNGTCRPDWDTIQKIIEATNGAVTANDFVARPPRANGEKVEPAAA